MANRTEVKIEKDDFDSRMLGEESGKISIAGDLENPEDIDEMCRTDGIRHIVLFVRHTRHNIETLFRDGFQFLTSKVRYGKALQKNVPIDISGMCNVAFVDYNPRYLEDLIKLSSIIGERSRYFLDPQFIEKWQEVYRQWILNAVNGYVDKMIIAAINGKAVGFILVKKDSDNVAIINLIAVDTKYHGKRIGLILTRLAEQWAADNGFTEIEVVTEAENIPAQRLYQISGYTIVDYYLVYSKDYGG